MGNTAKITLVIMIATILLGALLSLNEFNIFPLSKVSDFFLTSSPAPTPTPKPNVLYAPSQDPTGRDIYYQTFDEDGKGENVPYSGVGVMSRPINALHINKDSSSSASFTYYIVGSFDRWESIPNSEDKYIILKDLLTKDDTGKNARPIPKVRIGFERNTNEKKIIFRTLLAVEDLSTVIPKLLQPTRFSVKYGMGFIGNISLDDLTTLIRKNDAIALKTYIDQQRSGDLLDPEGNRIASDLFIRRFNAKKQIQQEIGKNTILQ